jgi:tetratricopeptide (TPR) repeat protein
VLRRAAVILFPNPGSAERRPFLEQALAILDQQTAPLTADDLHGKAQVLDSLGHPAGAVAAYEAALQLDPQQAGWRFALARLLYQQGRLQEARRELRTVLSQQPKNTRAQELLDGISREIAEKL